MLGGSEAQNDQASYEIVQQFLRQFTGGEDGIIRKDDFIKTVMKNRELLTILSPFYGINEL